MTDYLAESKFSYADIDFRREEIARDLVKKINDIPLYKLS